MKLRFPLAVAAALTVVVPAAHASPVTPWVTVDANGDPVLQAWITPGAFVWKECAPGQPCVTLSETGYMLEPGPTVPGTYFEITQAPGQHYKSPVWQGPRVDVAPPVPTGPMVVGSAVGLQPGSWTAGWADATSESLYVCDTPAGARCDDFTVGATLTAEHVGRYVVARRQHAGTARTISSPFNLEAGTSLMQSASGPVVNPPAPPAQPAPVAAPTVTLRKRALRSKGKLSLGRITCAAAACRVSLKVSGGGTKATTSTFVAKRGVTAIKVPARRGKLTVRVHVDGKLLANGKVTAR